MEDFWAFLRVNASLIVSICALVLTVSSAWATRQHNKLSVRPRLATFLSRKLAADDPSILMVRSTLRNSGLGPAIITKYSALLDGVEIQVAEAGEYYKVFAEAIQATAVPERCTFSRLGRGYVMAKDEVLEVAHVGIKGPLSPGLGEELKRFQLRVTFESAYGESFVYDSRDHSDVLVVDRQDEAVPT